MVPTISVTRRAPPVGAGGSSLRTGYSAAGRGTGGHTRTMTLHVTRGMTFEQVHQQAARVWGCDPRRTALKSLDGASGTLRGQIPGVGNAVVRTELVDIMPTYASRNLKAEPAPPPPQQVASDDRLWRIFTHYCIDSDASSPFYMRLDAFLKLLSACSAVWSKIGRGPAAVVFHGHTGAGKRLDYPAFLDSLLAVSKRAHPSASSTTSFASLLVQDVFPMCATRAIGPGEAVWDKQSQFFASKLYKSTFLVSSKLMAAMFQCYCRDEEWIDFGQILRAAQDMQLAHCCGSTASMAAVFAGCAEIFQATVRDKDRLFLRTHVKVSYILPLLARAVMYRWMTWEPTPPEEHLVLSVKALLQQISRSVASVAVREAQTWRSSGAKLLSTARDLVEAIKAVCSTDRPVDYLSRLHAQVIQWGEAAREAAQSSLPPESNDLVEGGPGSQDWVKSLAGSLRVVPPEQGEDPAATAMLMLSPVGHARALSQFGASGRLGATISPKHKAMTVAEVMTAMEDATRYVQRIARLIVSCRSFLRQAFSVGSMTWNLVAFLPWPADSEGSYDPGFVEAVCAEGLGLDVVRRQLEDALVVTGQCLPFESEARAANGFAWGTAFPSMPVTASISTAVLIPDAASTLPGFETDAIPRLLQLYGTVLVTQAAACMVCAEMVSGALCNPTTTSPSSDSPDDGADVWPWPQRLHAAFLGPEGIGELVQYQPRIISFQRAAEHSCQLLVAASSMFGTASDTLDDEDGDLQLKMQRAIVDVAASMLSYPILLCGDPSVWAPAVSQQLAEQVGAAGLQLRGLVRSPLEASGALRRYRARYLGETGPVADWWSVAVEYRSVVLRDVMAAVDIPVPGLHAPETPSLTTSLPLGTTVLSRVCCLQQSSAKFFSDIFRRFDTSRVTIWGHSQTAAFYAALRAADNSLTETLPHAGGIGSTLGRLTSDEFLQIMRWCCLRQPRLVCTTLLLSIADKPDAEIPATPDGFEVSSNVESPPPSPTSTVSTPMTSKPLVLHRRAISAVEGPPASATLGSAVSQVMSDTETDSAGEENIDAAVLAAMQNEQVQSARFVDFVILLGRGSLSLDLSWTFCRGLNELEFEAQVLDRFPARSYADGCDVPENLGMFCFPANITLETRKLPPSIFSFVLTVQDGTLLYCSCLILWEKLSDVQVADMLRECNEDVQSQLWATQILHGAPAGEVYAPKAVCVVSHHPFITTFAVILRQFARILRSHPPLPFERYISHVVNHVPLPPHGITAVQFALADVMITLQRPAFNDFPLLDADLELLFLCLDVNNVLQVLCAMLTERSIVLCSSRRALLTPIAECLKSLIFPFQWETTYIPVLPRRLLEFVMSPVPFMYGIVGPCDLSLLQSNDLVVLVDLDKNAVITADSMPLPRPPEHEAKKLIARLKQAVGQNSVVPKGHDWGAAAHVALDTVDHAFSDSDEEGRPIKSFNVATGVTAQHRGGGSSATSPTSTEFQTAAVRDSFLQFLVQLFMNYRKFVEILDPGKEASPFRSRVQMNKKAFLSSNPAARPLLSQILETQLFQLFLNLLELPNPPPRLAYFEDAIRAKRNRSTKMRMLTAREDTPFLSDTSQRVISTYVVPPPSGSDLPKRAYSYTQLGRFEHSLFAAMPTVGEVPQFVLPNAGKYRTTPYRLARPKHRAGQPPPSATPARAMSMAHLIPQELSAAGRARAETGDIITIPTTLPEAVRSVTSGSWMQPEASARRLSFMSPAQQRRASLSEPAAAALAAAALRRASVPQGLTLQSADNSLAVEECRHIVQELILRAMYEAEVRVVHREAEARVARLQAQLNGVNGHK